MLTLLANSYTPWRNGAHTMPTALIGRQRLSNSKAQSPIPLEELHLKGPHIVLSWCQMNIHSIKILGKIWPERLLCNGLLSISHFWNLNWRCQGVSKARNLEITSLGCAGGEGGKVAGCASGEGGKVASSVFWGDIAFFSLSKSSGPQKLGTQLRPLLLKMQSRNQQY